MGWLSDFGHWLLVSEGGLWVGSALIWAGLVTLGGYLVWRYGDVRMGPDPTPRPLPDATTVVVPAPVQYQHEWFPAGEWLMAIEETTAAVIDLTDTVEILEVVDPLADTVELEVADETTPLFYTIRRPKPYDLEGFTREWTKERIARVIEAGRPE